MRFLVCIILLLKLSNSFAQGETWNWCFGDSAGIKFVNGKNPIGVTNYRDWSYEGSSVISDKNGKLQFYGYCFYLYDSTHKRLNNNFILKGEWSSCQSMQLIRHKKSSTINIFTTCPTYEVSLDGFNYSAYNNGFKTINKRIVKDIGEKQTSIFHHNNNDIWVNSHSMINDTFYSFLVTKNGLIECPVINKKGANYVDENPTQGILKFSPSGKYCANANWNLNRIELYRYDRENSRLYDLVTIVQFFPYAVEFSPDERFLYFTDRGEHIYQVKLNNWNKDSIEKSKKTIVTYKREEFNQMQIGPDGKIYVAQYLRNYIGCIRNPNIEGSSAGYKDSAVFLGGRICEGGLPNFNASYFYTPSVDYSYEQDCRTNTIEFNGKDTFTATTHNWQFSKGNFISNKTGNNISYSFSDTGKWRVKYIASKGLRKDSVTKTITIYSKLEPGFLGKDINFCNLPVTAFAPKNLHCIHWYNDTIAEIGKADSVRLSKEGTYYAKATNQSFCVEWDTIQVLKVVPKASFTVSDICANDSAAFINTSKFADSYKWKFGDGNISSHKDSRHLYQAKTTTTFNVTLMVTFGGCLDSITNAITVNSIPRSDFTYALSGKEISLEADQAGLQKYLWKFGTTDSAVTSTLTYTHNFKSSGQYRVCLKAMSLEGCFSETCKTVTLGITSIETAFGISIYPNPNKGKFHIEIVKAGNYALKVFSPTGQLVLDKILKGCQSNTVNLNQHVGNYTIEIRNESGEVFTKKMLLE